MTWFQIWTVCWQVAVFATPILLACVVLWMNSKYVTKADATVERNRVDGLIDTQKNAAKAEANRVDAEFGKRKSESDARWDQLRDRTADHEGRIKSLEADVAKPPSRHTLNNELAKVQAGLHSVGRSLDDIRHQMEARDSDIRRTVETMNAYMHTLIERGLGAPK